MEPRPTFPTILLGIPLDASSVPLTATAAIPDSVFRARCCVPVSLYDAQLARVIHKPIPRLENLSWFFAGETHIACRPCGMHAQLAGLASHVTQNIRSEILKAPAPITCVDKPFST